MDPPWDDLREQRVLRGVREGRATRLRRRRAVRVAAVGAGAVAIVALAVGWGARTHSSSPAAAVAAPLAAPEPSGSVLSLEDGSRLSIQPNADVHVELQRPDEVRLVQRAGVVNYDVRPDPGRRFEVRASSVRVVVKGTAFQVRVDPESVSVRVDRGRVVVEDASGGAELGAGEELKRAVLAPPREVTSVDSAETPSAPAVAPRASADMVPTVEELLDRADRARGAGRLDEAAAALQSILALHPRDKRAGTVLFTLGRVERARGNHAAAAADFRACAQGPLAEDALAEEASSWMAAGQSGQARVAAQRYLDRFPDGPHVARMKRILP